MVSATFDALHPTMALRLACCLHLRYSFLKSRSRLAPFFKFLLLSLSLSRSSSPISKVGWIFFLLARRQKIVKGPKKMRRSGDVTGLAFCPIMPRNSSRLLRKYLSPIKVTKALAFSDLSIIMRSLPSSNVHRSTLNHSRGNWFVS